LAENAKIAILTNFFLRIMIKVLKRPHRAWNRNESQQEHFIPSITSDNIRRFSLVVVYCHVIVEGALGCHLLATDVAVVFKHSRKVDRFAVVPHGNSADEPFATDGAGPLILSRPGRVVFLDKLKKFFWICETQSGA
jgi:hypothetical protein